MKTTLALLFLFSTLSSIEIIPEVRAAYVQSTDKRFRDIYNHSGLYSIETSVQLRGNIYPFASLGYMYTSGSSSQGDSTRLYQIPIGLGMKYFILKNSFRPYLGAGASIAYTNIRNNNKYVTKSQSAWGIGPIVKLGILGYFKDSFFIDFFADYVYMKKDFKHRKGVVAHKADLSQVAIGIGFGYEF